jgi:hypothetical protein
LDVTDLVTDLTDRSIPIDVTSSVAGIAHVAVTTTRHRRACGSAAVVVAGVATSRSRRRFVGVDLPGLVPWITTTVVTATTGAVVGLAAAATVAVGGGIGGVVARTTMERGFASLNALLGAEQLGEEIADRYRRRPRTDAINQGVVVIVEASKKIGDELLLSKRLPNRG